MRPRRQNYFRHCFSPISGHAQSPRLNHAVDDRLSRTFFPSTGHEFLLSDPSLALPLKMIKSPSDARSTTTPCQVQPTSATTTAASIRVERD
jgi:hypothetical protein